MSDLVLTMQVLAVNPDKPRQILEILLRRTSLWTSWKNLRDSVKSAWNVTVETPGICVTMNVTVTTPGICVTWNVTVATYVWYRSVTSLYQTIYSSQSHLENLLILSTFILDQVNSLSDLWVKI